MMAYPVASLREAAEFRPYFGDVRIFAHSATQNRLTRGTGDSWTATSSTVST